MDTATVDAPSNVTYEELAELEKEFDDVELEISQSPSILSSSPSVVLPWSDTKFNCGLF